SAVDTSHREEARHLFRIGNTRPGFIACYSHMGDAEFLCQRAHAQPGILAAFPQFSSQGARLWTSRSTLDHVSNSKKSDASQVSPVTVIDLCFAVRQSCECSEKHHSL